MHRFWQYFTNWRGMAEKCPKTNNWCELKLETAKKTFLCTIDNFNKCIEKTGESLESSTFSADADFKTEWSLLLYPNGFKEESKEYVSAFLSLNSSDREEVTTNFRISVINSNQEIYSSYETTHLFKAGALDYGWDKFMSRSLIKDPKNQLLPNDMLSIYCELTISGKRKVISGQTIEAEPRETLIDDMSALFTNMDYSDIEILVKGHSFRAHKLILMARSRVFEAMFKHQMKENLQNQIIIDDIDKEVFEKVLLFIYTDKAVKEDIDFNKDLLYASDKYQLNGLKSVCEEYLSSQLTLESVCDIFILADTHSAEVLKANAIDFVKKNGIKIAKTEQRKK